MQDFQFSRNSCNFCKSSIGHPTEKGFMNGKESCVIDINKGANSVVDPILIQQQYPDRREPPKPLKLPNSSSTFDRGPDTPSFPTATSPSLWTTATNETRPNSGSIPLRHHSSLVHNSSDEQLADLYRRHRGELSINEKYRYELSKAQLKASSRTSALLSGFAMVALVELQYQENTPKPMLIILGIVTTLLVSVHLLALMMSTCLLPYIEANGCTQDSPHIRLKFYIELSWLFSTCIGLLLFLVEIGVILFVKFNAVGYNLAAYITTGMLVPMLIIFIVISYLIHRSRLSHTIDRVNDKVVDLHKFLYDAEVNHTATQQQHLATSREPLNTKREHANIGAGDNIRSIREI